MLKPYMYVCPAVLDSANVQAMTDEEKTSPPPPFAGGEVEVGEILNASGHPQELDRQLGFWSICAISVIADNAWAAGGGTLVYEYWANELHEET